MNSHHAKLLSDGVRRVSACPLCQAKPEHTKTRVLESRDDHCLVHVTCGNCGHAMLSMVQLMDSGVQCVGILTDLSFEEAKQARSTASVAFDDVLMVHESLNTGQFLGKFRKTTEIA